MADTLDTLNIVVEANGSVAVNGIQQLTTAVTGLKQAAAGGFNLSAGIGQLTKLAEAIKSVDLSKLTKIREAANAATAAPVITSAVGEAAATPPPVSTTLSGATASPSVMEQGATQISAISNAAAEAQSMFESASNSVTLFCGAVSGTINALQLLPAQIKKTADSFKNLHKTTTQTTGAMGKLFNVIKRIALYKAIRGAIGQIVKGLNEGLQNVVTWSRSVNGTIATALDGIATHGQVMKNQLGAAFGELLTTLAPIINAIISLITRIADAISQLFAILGGRATYTKATSAVKQWGKAAGGAGKAAKEWKNQLLGFDEINRLNEPSSGGGGGGGGDLGDNGFAEVPVGFEHFRHWWEEFKKTIGNWWNSVDFGPLTASWERLTDALKNFAAALDPILKYVVEKILLPFFTFVLENRLPGILDQLASGFQFWADILSGDFAGAMNEYKNYMADSVIYGLEPFTMWLDSLLGTDVTGWLHGLQESLHNTDISGWCRQAWQDIREFAQGFWNAIDNIFISIGEWTVTAWANISTFFSNLAQSASDTWTTITGGISELARKIKSIAEEIGEKIRSIFDGIKTFVSGFRLPHISLPHLQISWEPAGGLAQFFGITSIPRLSVQWYASGGFPTAGQLFVANEHGPEMVGSMDGRSAVANNDQIVEGIEAGVYRAMTAAMQNGSFTAKVYLDGREIKTSQTRLARAMGV